MESPREDRNTCLCVCVRLLNLEVSALGFEPVLDVAFGISGEAEHEVPLDLQLVDGLDGLVDLGKSRLIKNN